MSRGLLMQTGEQDLLELFHERAAIRQYDGGLTRIEAERLAYFELRNKYGREAIPAEVVEIVRKGQGGAS